MDRGQFTESEACPLLAKQPALLAESLQFALVHFPPEDQALGIALAEAIGRLMAPQPTLQPHEPGGPLRDLARMHWQAGRHDAALAWARCAYISSRHMANGWLNSIYILLAAGTYPAIGLSPVPGMFDAIPATRIPRRIMQYWDKPTPPPDVARLIETWRTKNLAFAYRLINDDIARRFLRLHFGPRILRAYDSAPHVSSKCDIFRLAWIYHHGGLYADADEECRGKIMQLLPPNSSLVLTYTEGEPPCINNWFLAATTAHPLIEAALRLAVITMEWMHRSGTKLSAWSVTGPGILSTAILDDWALTGTPKTTKSLQLIIEPEYRKIVGWHTDLEYRSTAEGNWRVAATNQS